MSGPTPAAAARATRDALQVLLSCISDTVLRVDATGPTTIIRARSRLTRSLGGPIGLVILHDFVVIADSTLPRRERWRTRTVGYEYALEDVGGREIVAYHWHPRGLNHFIEPHLHLGAGLCDLPVEMAKAHLHTGRVTPVAVLALAVERYSVAPRRPDWPAIFERAAHALAQ